MQCLGAFHVEVLVLEPQAFLPRDERKAPAQFEQEPSCL
jgi:hypothetical protein